MSIFNSPTLGNIELTAERKNHILTAYITDRIRIGEKYETEKKYF